MDASLYKRPNKPRTMEVTPRRDDHTIKELEVKEPLMIDAGSECHVTPEDVARRMVEYLPAPGYGHTLEPSAGTGALVKAATDAGHLVQAVERHYKLVEVLEDIIPAHRVSQGDFLEWSQDAAPYEHILMNPPFKGIKAHMSAAIKLLDPIKGVLVALVPTTYQHERAEVLEVLGPDTFAHAKVNTKIIRIEM